MGTPFTAVVERDLDTGLFVAYLPGYPGAHAQADSIDALLTDLTDVVEMLLEDDDLQPESEFAGVLTIHPREPQ